MEVMEEEIVDKMVDKLSQKLNTQLMYVRAYISWHGPVWSEHIWYLTSYNLL